MGIEDVDKKKENARVYPEKIPIQVTKVESNNGVPSLENANGLYNHRARSTFFAVQP